jgi:hypothetical protein
MRRLSVRLPLAIAAALLCAARVEAQSSIDKLSFYGFLNQGYGVSTAQPILGLNKDASGDYRAAALQVRYAISSTDNFIVQAGSRAIGTSPLSSAPGTVNLDWAFYHHRFDAAAVRVGRMPVPFGFLSETRDVGTLLPMYRAPASYYLESFRSVDGAMVDFDVPLTGGALGATAYVGGTNGSFLTWLPTSVVVSRLRLERMIGGNLTYNTPLPGVQLRGGLAALRTLDTAKVQAAPASKFVVLSGGLEATYDRFLVRGETRRIKIGSNSRQYSTYLQTGARVLDKLWLNGQLDLASAEAYNGLLGGYVGRASADRALGFAWHFAPNVVGKMEQHFAKGGIDGFVPTGAETPYTNYSIASLAVSF